MDMKRKIAGGALFKSKLVGNPRAPQFSGIIEFDEPLLKHLLVLHKANQPLKLSLAGWNRQSKKGMPYVSLAITIPRQPTPRQDLADALLGAQAATKKPNILEDDIPFGDETS